MKILLSAFACGPYKGSEPGVGWNWAMNLAQYHEVCVVTRLENKEAIENYRNQYGLPFTVEYLGIDLFEKFKSFPFRENFYMMLWQKKLVKYVSELNKKQSFDILHHCTYATFKYPSRLYKVGVPLVVGPVGGGECTPKSCRKKFDFKGYVKELIHDAQIVVASKSSATRRMFAEATKILVTTEETLFCIPQKYRNKCEIMQTIGVDTSEINPISEDLNSFAATRFKLIFVGQLKLWKGMGLLVDLMYELEEKYPGQFELVIIGDGPDKSCTKKWIYDKKLDNIVTLKGNLSRTEVLANMEEAHAFIFPSFHDSGGMVVLEAMAKGIPVVILDVGGPKVNVADDIGYKVAAYDNYSRIVSAFVENIISIKDAYTNDKLSLIKRINKGKTFLATECTWNKKVIRINEIYKEVVQNG